MTRAKLCELRLILNELESTIMAMQKEQEWLTVAEVAELLKMCISSVATFKERPAFQPYIKYSTEGYMIKNTPEAIKLMRCYKYRNFEYEQQLLEKQASK